MPDAAGPSAASPAPALLPAVAPLGFLVGTWVGRGHGVFPTVEPFDYVERVELWQIGKPFIGYEQRSHLVDTDLPVHGENGFWRVSTPVGALDALEVAGAPIAVEATIAIPSGFCEIVVGTLERFGPTAAGRRITSTSTVTRTPSAKDVSAVARTIEVEGDVLRYTVRMAAMGHPLQDHLEAELHRA